MAENEIWTTAQLKEMYDRLFNERETRYEQRFQSQEEALRKADAERERKDAELNDVRHRFVPRETFDAFKEELSKRSRATIFAMIGMGITIAGLLLDRIP